jgi:hypothetical protein
MAAGMYLPVQAQNLTKSKLLEMELPAGSKKVSSAGQLKKSNEKLDAFISSKGFKTKNNQSESFVTDDEAFWEKLKESKWEVTQDAVPGFYLFKKNNITLAAYLEQSESAYRLFKENKTGLIWQSGASVPFEPEFYFGIASTVTVKRVY